MGLAGRKRTKELFELEVMITRHGQFYRGEDGLRWTTRL